MTYKIRAKTLNGDILTFTNVKSFSYVDGMIVFTDIKTQKVKRFSSSNVEIENE